MRRLCTAVAGVALAASCATPALTQGIPTTIGVIGNSVEMYYQNTCSTTTCVRSFPVNDTGRVIKITHIACEMTIPDGTLGLARFGPSATANGYLIKVSFFGSRDVVTQGATRIVYLTGAPDMFLGAGRYLSVRIESTGSGSYQSCQAAGVFAQ